MLGLFLSIPAHHSEPADPVLMDWITHQIDAIVGLGPAAILMALGFLIVAIPLGIMVLFLTQRARQNRPE